MYYIMSYNFIRGIVSGNFAELDHAFYRGPRPDGTIQWVPLISLAKEFPTEAQARAEILSIWHADFGFGILFVQPERTQNEQYALDALNRRKQLAVRLASNQVTADELVDMASKIPTEHGMTWRERWIIDIMTKGEANGS